jgi:hypothetical protein
MAILQRVWNEIGLMGEMELSSGLILRAFVVDLAIIHVELSQVDDFSTGDRGGMMVLDTMQVGQCKGKSLSFFACNELIDFNRVNWLLTFPLATTVAKRLPASEEKDKENVSHHRYPPRTADAGQYANGSRISTAAGCRRCASTLHHHSIEPHDIDTGL